MIKILRNIDFYNIENLISEFLFKLDFNDNIIVIMEFIPENRYFELDAPLILLSKPFMINRFSCSKTISNFIYERLEYMIDFYYLNDSVRLECRYREGPIIQLNSQNFIYNIGSFRVKESKLIIKIKIFFCFLKYFINFKFKNVLIL